MKTQYKVFTILLLVALTLGTLIITPVRAAGSIIVNTDTDTIANDGVCSLREAITNANTDDQSGSTDCLAGVGADTITFAGDYTITLVGSQLPPVTSNITITGNGAAKTIIQADAVINTAAYRVLEVKTAGDLTINALTVRHGLCNGGVCGSFGGGIKNAGTLAIINSLIYGNYTGNYGGGVYNAGSVTITNSTFSDNYAYYSGGGLYNVTGFTATLLNATFAKNRATMTGGGSITNLGTLNFTNTLVAYEPSMPSCYNSGGIIGTNLNNLVQNNASGVNACGTPAVTSAPLLGDLADNGGSTLTHALLSGSPAFNAGDNAACPATDQRGVTRPQGRYCDIGAYEYAYPILYAKPGGLVSGLCDSWAIACELRYVLTNAAPGQEIWVQAGRYTPTDLATDRVATFQLVSGVGVYGGFVGTEPTRTDRDPATNVTLLSGDLLGDDAGFTNNTENSYHVVTGASSATLDGFTISGGNADLYPNHYGGGMANTGSSSQKLTNIVFTGNSASVGGGGLNNQNADITLTNVTFNGNKADYYGGGMFNGSAMAVLANVTFSDNLALDSGGGINNLASTVMLTNATFSGNSATVSGGGMSNGNGYVAIKNSVLWGNTAPADAQISNDTTLLDITDSVVNGGCPTGGICVNLITDDPKLGTLGNYGGSTPTIPLMAGSSAIDMGNNTVCAAPVGDPIFGAGGLDQRGVTRPVGAACDIGAYEFAIQTGPAIVVNSATDSDDGYCETADISTDCTLREALNGAASGATITFAGDYAITLASTLTIANDLTIDGTGHNIVLSGDNDGNGTADVHVLEVNSGVTASLIGLTITKGYSATGGGAINNAGALTVTNSTFLDSKTTVSGGAINTNGALTVFNSTFSGNQATVWGGGIALGSGTLEVTNSTFSGNSVTNYGGGLGIFSGTATLTNSTFSANSASTGGGINNGNGTLNYTNTIIANSTSGGDCLNSYIINVNANNLVEDGTCSAILSGDPKLEALASNGGPTQTIALPLNSPAVNAGDNAACPATDQRGVTRPMGASCDIGAYELATQTGAAIVVNSEADTDDGYCEVASSGTNCTLREAITAANAYSGAATITFAGNYTITLAGSQLPAITNTVTITGNGPANTLIQADPVINTSDYRVFEVDAAGNLTLAGLTVKHGLCNGGCNTENYAGGGALNNGALTVKNSLFVGNWAANYGGAIYNLGALTVTASTFTDSFSSNGGAIFNDGDGTAAITNSTFTANVANNAGGAIYQGGASMAIKNTTISGNQTNVAGGPGTASGGGGVYIRFNDTLDFANTIIANSTLGGDCLNDGGFIGVNQNNLIADGSCDNVAYLSGNPKLGALADNGGPTQTMALLPGSPVLGQGDPAICAAVPVNNLDQRGEVRPQGDVACDIGAHESSLLFDNTPPTITITEPDTLPAQSKIITAGVSDGTLTMSNTTGTVCDGSLIFVTYASQTFSLESDNGTKVCYQAVDDADNIAYSLSNAIAGIDTTAPIISITNPDTLPALSKTLTASMSETGTLTMSNTTGAVCDGSLTFVAYASQTFSLESDNGTKVCYQAVDALGNIGYSLSNAIAGIDTTAPIITITNPDTLPAQSKTLTASASDGTLTMSNTTGSVCDGTLTFVAYANQTFTLETDNGTKACYKAVDALGNTGYNLSNAIAGIDTTAPAVVTFTAPATSNVLAIPITAFTASDGAGSGVAGYLITHSNVAPSAGWLASMPATYTVTGNGTYTLYPWVKDAAGNVSAEFATPVTVVVNTVAAPTAVTNAASSVGVIGATLNGTINAQGANTTVTFEYGLTTAYGTTVTAAESPLTGAADTPVTAAISGLTPNTTYHFRVVAQNAGGTIQSGDLTFTTQAMVERLKNGGLELFAKPTTPKYWTISKFGLTDGKSTVKKVGKFAVQIVGQATVTKTLSQTVTVSGGVGDPFSFSVWAKGSKLAKTGTCQVQILLYNGTTLAQSQTVKCPTGTFAWKQLKADFTALKPYTKAVVKFTFKKAGTVWFDAASLKR